MKVKNLIKKLEKLDQNEDILFDFLTRTELQKKVKRIIEQGDTKVKHLEKATDLVLCDMHNLSVFNGDHTDSIIHMCLI